MTDFEIADTCDHKAPQDIVNGYVVCAYCGAELYEVPHEEDIKRSVLDKLREGNPNFSEVEIAWLTTKLEAE